MSIEKINIESVEALTRRNKYLLAALTLRENPVPLGFEEVAQAGSGVQNEGLVHAEQHFGSRLLQRKLPTGISIARLDSNDTHTCAVKDNVVNDWRTTS